MALKGCPQQDDVPTPPGGTLPSGTSCVTRMASISLGWRVDIIPLNYTLLAEASASNNLAAFPGGKHKWHSHNLSCCPLFMAFKSWTDCQWQ